MAAELRREAWTVALVGRSLDWLQPAYGWMSGAVGYAWFSDCR
ncbi:MAG TPA: hypothetical protein PL166_08620 [Candidatus Contendobacter sp.]|nr:hypothetical protein [Candidatus Contendobacter sp.]HRD49647.1 hypothetical protein [Candidatus Contendobacter sp.]